MTLNDLRGTATVTAGPAILPVNEYSGRIAGSSVYEPCIASDRSGGVTPGDELLPLKAIEIAQPGDVIVVVGAYSPRFSLWGGIMSIMAKTRGVAGLVTDGLVRDAAQTRAIGFPIYAAGLTPMAPCMNVPPGELNYPISFGTADIRPGDLIVADEDGVVCVPQEQIEAVRAAVRARIEKEDAWLREIEETRGMILKDTVDRLLAARTTEIA